MQRKVIVIKKNIPTIHIHYREKRLKQPHIINIEFHCNQCIYSVTISVGMPICHF